METANHSETFEEFRASMRDLREEMKETDRQMKETDRRLKETDRIVSKLGNRFGELVEHMVIPDIINKFNERGYHFTRISNDLVIKRPGSACADAEVDILLENDDVVIAVEVKSKPDSKDVNEHVNRIEFLRKDADRRNDSRKYQGAIAAAIMVDSVRNYVQKTGFYTIEQSGETLRITVPDDFIPRNW